MFDFGYKTTKWELPDEKKARLKSQQTRLKNRRKRKKRKN
jgi:hypothetical protein